MVQDCNCLRFATCIVLNFPRCLRKQDSAGFNEVIGHSCKNTLPDIPCTQICKLVTPGFRLAQRWSSCLQKLDTPFKERIPAKLQHYWPNMWKVMSLSWQQATTMPTGIHAEFIKHGVDAVTIETYMQPSEVSCKQLPCSPLVFNWWCWATHSRACDPDFCDDQQLHVMLVITRSGFARLLTLCMP